MISAVPWKVNTILRFVRRLGGVGTLCWPRYTRKYDSQPNGEGLDREKLPVVGPGSSGDHVANSRTVESWIR